MQGCDKGFKEHCNFDQHLKEHGKVKVFECNRCEKTFYTKWRRDKHLGIHRTEETKFCHYFNNLMKSLDVNSSMKYLMIVDFRGDVQTNFANTGIMQVMENRKIGSARKVERNTRKYLEMIGTESGKYRESTGKWDLL